MERRNQISLKKIANRRRYSCCCCFIVHKTNFNEKTKNKS